MLSLCWVNGKNACILCASFGYDLKMSDNMSEYFSEKMSDRMQEGSKVSAKNGFSNLDKKHCNINTIQFQNFNTIEK